jgi:hypothetical protein
MKDLTIQWLGEDVLAWIDALARLVVVQTMLLGMLLAAGCSREPTSRQTSAVLATSAVAAWEANVRLALEHGYVQEADQAAGRLLAASEAQLGSTHPDTLRAADLYATTRLLLNRYEDADALLMRALAGCEATAGRDSLLVAERLDRLAEIALYRGKPNLAKQRLTRAVLIRGARLGPTHIEVARTLLAFGKAALRACDETEAETAFRRALVIYEQHGGPESADTAQPLLELAEARWQAKDDTGSEQYVRRALAVLELHEGTHAAALVRALGVLATKLKERGDRAGAEANAERALAIAERRLRATDQDLAIAADVVAELYREQGDAVAADALLRRLRLVERMLPPGTTSSPTPSTLKLAGSKESGARCAPPADANGEVGGAARVVTSLAPAFRACYNALLRKDPDAAGWVRMTAKIGPEGDVLTVRTLEPASFAEELVTCPMQRLLEAKFRPPDGGGATIVVPVTFVVK